MRTNKHHSKHGLQPSAGLWTVCYKFVIKGTHRSSGFRCFDCKQTVLQHQSTRSVGLSHWTGLRPQILVTFTTHILRSTDYKPQDRNWRQGEPGFILWFRALSSLLLCYLQVLTFCPSAYLLQITKQFPQLKTSHPHTKIPTKEGRDKQRLLLPKEENPPWKPPGKLSLALLRWRGDWRTKFLTKKSGIIMTIFSWL